MLLELEQRLKDLQQGTYTFLILFYLIPSVIVIHGLRGILKNSFLFNSDHY